MPTRERLHSRYYNDFVSPPRASTKPLFKSCKDTNPCGKNWLSGLHIMGSQSIDIEHITRSNFVDEQGPQKSRKYMAYASAYGLRVVCEGLTDPNQLQQVYAKRQQIDNEMPVPSVTNSPASNVVEADDIDGIRVSVDYDRAEQGGAVFPWSEVKNVLGDSSTVYDVPVTSVVIRFSAEDFTQMWKDKITDAVDDPNFPTGWIEEPFYAVLESAKPDSTGRQKVKSDHDKRYFLPKSNTTSQGDQGLGWTPRILDLARIWSHKGWTEGDDQQLKGWSDRQKGGDWTAKRIEQRLINFFEPDLQYTGMLRDDKLMNKWRSVISRGKSQDYTSYKTFRWEDEEEWMLQT